MDVGIVATYSSAVSLALLTFFFPPVLTGSTELAWLLSEERLIEEAIFIGGVEHNHIHQALFPDIGFSCLGNLTRWTLVASPVGGGLRYPEVHVWSRDGITDSFTRFKRNKLSSSSPNPESRVYEAIRDPPLMFQSGDVLGVYNPTIPALNLMYQNRGGPRNYFIDGPTKAPTEFSLDGGLVQENRNDYPLVSVDVEPPECAFGFIDRDTLIRKASLLTVNSSDLEYRQGTQRIIPDIAFPTDGTIESVTVGALRQIGTSHFPEIQIWRSTDQHEWFKVATIDSSAALTYNIALNVHRYTPPSPVAIQQGDILGFYQPHTASSVLRIFMQREGPVNYYRSALFSPLDRMTASGATETRVPLIRFQFSSAVTDAPPDFPTSTSNTTTEGSSTKEGSDTPSTVEKPTTEGGNNTLSSTNNNPNHHPATPTAPINRATTSAELIAGTIVGTVVVLILVMAAMGVAVVVFKITRVRVVWEWRGENEEPRYDIPVHPRVPPNIPPQEDNTADNRADTTAETAISNSMEYNGLYVPGDPNNVATGGPLDMKRNTAYHMPEGATNKAISATNPVVHPYEDVSI